MHNEVVLNIPEVINAALDKCRLIIVPKDSYLVPVAYGHWIITHEDWQKYECSECGWTKRVDYGSSLDYTYCPHCGADMRSERVVKDNAYLGEKGEKMSKKI